MAVDVAAIDLGFAPRPAHAVSLVPVADEGVLVDARGDRVHALNALGALVWQCLDGVGTLREIALDLAEGFAAPLDRVEADLLVLTRAMATAGVLDGITPGDDVRSASERAAETEEPTTDPRFVGPPPNA